MSHHSCSCDTSILKVATGVVLGIWAAKLIPILIIGVVGLAIWLVYLLVRACWRTLEYWGVVLMEIDRRLARRYSRRTAQAVWVVLLAMMMGGMLLVARTPIR
jgi:ABC-type Na+ efflux pump permease subunit